MKLKEALEILGITDYAKRIMDSSQTGELGYLNQYIRMAEGLGETKWFALWFTDIVDHVDKHWSNPSGIFQHIERYLHHKMEVIGKQRKREHA
jgi:hypothetical protein